MSAGNKPLKVQVQNTITQLKIHLRFHILSLYSFSYNFFLQLFDSALGRAS